MQCSVVKSSDCSRYDFGYLLFSPEFFLADKLYAWNRLDIQSSQNVSDCFLHIKRTINTINESVICYDLTAGLPKFLDHGIEVERIESTKKIAKENDFIISRLRSYLQEMGIVEERDKEQIFSTEFLIFRAKTDKLSTYSLFALCMTKFVQTILKRGQYGTEHPRFYDFLLFNLPIPDSVLTLNNYIEQVINSALYARRLSRHRYTKAQNLLLSELGLLAWRPKHRLAFVRNYSEANQVGRMDAEYFQPKYDEVVKAIKGYSGGWDMLGNMVSITKCVEVGSKEYRNEGIPFIRVSNLSSFEITEEKYISEQLYYELKQHQPKQGEILFTKDATPGIAHYLSNAPGKMILSGGILRLQSKEQALNMGVLSFVLNSLPIKEQVSRDVGGSVIMHWRVDQIKQIFIPVLNAFTAASIQRLVTESFTLRKRSNHLLECAKGAVEIAIEQDEQTAIDWLERAYSTTPI